jgi:1-acyl-sn-glycerol-3-phosphate acyltransferase
MAMALSNPSVQPEQMFDPESLDDELWNLLGSRLDGVIAVAASGDRKHLHQVERSWAAAVSEALDIRIDMIGFDRIDPNRQYIVAPLHEGFADVLALLQLPLDLNWAIRDELLRLPYFGEYLSWAGHIAIEPEAPRTALRKLLRGARRTFAAGESLVVFPQGSLLGIETAFQGGAFQLAEAFDVPLLPVVLTGSHRVWEYPFSKTLRRGQRIRIEVLDPIESTWAAAAMLTTERELKRRALAVTEAPARRYQRERDGLWDGYRVEIDPDFATVGWGG